MNLNTAVRQVHLQMLALLTFLVFCAFALHAPSALAAQAPANAVIGNQASATYNDFGGTSRNSSSNTVQTTVAQVKSFTLTQTGAKSASANQQVCYPHTITNTGNGGDTYALNTPTTGGMFAHTGLVYYVDANQDGSPDNGTAITTSGLLAAGLSYNYVVCGTTPVAAVVGQAGTITVTATDTNANTQSRTDTTTIAAASISVQKKLSSVPPPGYTPVPSGASPNAGPLYVILDYTNSGTIQGDNLLITDALPSGWLYVPGSGRWSGSGATALTDAAGGDPVGVAYSAPTTAVSGTITSTVTTVPGSTSGNIYFQITIAPNLAVTIPANQAITTNTATYGYSYTFNAMTVIAPTTNTNSVLYSVLQTAAVSANGSATTTGLTDNEPVTVASASPGQTITWTDYIWNTGNSPDSFDISILNTPLNGSACLPTNNAAAGQCTFPANTTFQILAASGMTTLLDSNGNSTPDTGIIPIPSGGACAAPYIISTSVPLRCGYPIVISATIPAGATPGNNGGAGYQITVSAASFFNSAGVGTDTVPNKLTTIATNTVDLTNNVSVAGGATVAQGLGAGTATVITTNSVTPATASTTTTRFQLYVNNTSAVAQIYNLSSLFVSVPAAGGIVNPPTGWTVAFKLDGGANNCTTTAGSAITSTGATPIAIGGSLLICAEVVVPATSSGAGMATPTYAAPGAYVLEFKATQQSNAAVFDTKRDQVTVLNVHNVTITPNGAQSTVPGGAVTYTHLLTNNGNVSEAITFPTAAFLTDNQTPTYAWSSTAYIDTNNNGVLDIGTDTPVAFGTTTFNVAPNGSQTIFVRVNAPAMAGSPVNTTSLTATYFAGATASASDQTTLTDGLKLDKYQQLPGGTGSCVTAPTTTLTGSAPNAAWINTPIVASPNTIPGKCIAYLIVGSNTTAANISAINLSDQIPPNTKLETGCGAPVVTGPIALQTPGLYVSGYTGMITAASTPLSTTPLPPTGVFSLQFCVKIN